MLSRGQYAQHCFDRKQGEEISYYSEKYNVDFPSREIVFPSKEKSSVVVESTDDTPLETTDESPLVVTDDDVIETTDESPLVVGDGDVIETTDESPLVVGDDTPTEIVDAPKKDSFVVTNLTQRRDKPSNKLEDYIHIFENVLSDDLCDQIVSTFNDDSLLGPSVIRDNTINDHRTCTSCQISVPNDNIPEDKRLYLDGELLKSINEVTRMYTEIHPWVHVETDTGYTFLKYAEGQHYTQHTDSFKDEQRSISCSFLLNDDFKGGEFCLFDRDLKLTPKKGSVIMFPSSFMYPHEILPVTENARYSIITWLV